MDKELQVVPQQLSQQAQPTPVSLTQTGNENTQIAYVERYEQNVAIFSSAPQAGSGFSRFRVGANHPSAIISRPSQASTAPQAPSV